MQLSDFRRIVTAMAFATGLTGLVACGPQPGGVSVNLANSSASNTNISGTTGNINTSSMASSASSASVETKEPERYQALVTIKLEAIGEQRKTALPTLSATVARTGTDRRMEFGVPTGGTVIFLDKSGVNYLILPDKKQYAELNRDSLGFDVRRMLMPEQIVQQIKNASGVERVGEEKYNGRDCIKYRYAAAANTQTRADTEAFLLVDKETGLPLHSETVSQSQSGGKMRGYTGLRVITEITDVTTDVAPALFDRPADFQKIDAPQVRIQVDLIFNTLAALVTQTMQQPQTTPTSPSNK